MKKLTDSAIFTRLAGNPKVMENIANINLQRDKINLQDYKSELDNIDRRINLPTKGKIFYNLNNGRIILINNPTISLPKYLHAIGKVNSNNQVAMTVSLNGHISPTGEIYPKKLFTLLQGATISLELFENWNRYTMHIEFIKNASMSYSKLVGKVFDKIFAINIDDFKSDLIHFYLAKFFLVNMCGRGQSDTINNIAYSSCFNKNSLKLILDEEQGFTEDVYDNIFNLFSNLKYVKGLESLNVRSFIENWVRMYGESTLLALDYLPSFLNMIFASITNGNINKEYIIDSVAGKMNNKAFVEFGKLIR